MKYPLHIEINATQDDFIQLEILQQAMLVEKQREINKKMFIGQSCFSLFLLAVLLVLAIKGTVVGISLIIPAVIEIFFMGNLFSNNSNAQRDYSYTVNHMLQNRDSHAFFAEEQGFVEFYEDRCEFLTNLQRRYFGYENIDHIKITKFLYIFVMKKSKDKNLKDFEFMILPRRNMLDREDEQLSQICSSIIEKYQLTPWNDFTVVG